MVFMKKIALISPTGIGDIVTISPMLRKLKETIPDSSITVLTAHKGSIYKTSTRTKYIDSIIYLGSVAGLIKALLTKWDILMGWGCVSDNRGFKKIAYFLLLHLFSAKQKKFYRLSDKELFDDKNVTIIRLNILRLMGISVTAEDAKLFPPFHYEGHEKRITELFHKVGIGLNDLKVMLHVGTQQGNACLYPSEKWAAVINTLVKRENIKVIFIGNEKDKILTEKIISLCDSAKNICNLCGQLALPDTVCAIKESSIFLSTNSGPMWLAACLQKKQILLSGPSGYMWDPYNPNAIVIRNIIKRKHCDPPCKSRYCHYKDNKCMRTLDPLQIISSFDSLIKKNTD